MLNELRYVFSRIEKLKLLVLLILNIIGSFFELIGVAVFMSFISLILDPQTAMEDSYMLAWIYQMMNISDIKEFLFFSTGDTAIMLSINRKCDAQNRCKYS